MKNDKLQTTQTNWGRIIILSAIIGLAVGTGLWWWQNSAAQPADDQILTGNISRPGIVEGTKPVVLANTLPATDRHLESLGDKLAETSFHLREQHAEYAQQSLAEAAEIALRTDDNPQLRETLLSGIKQAQNSLANGKTEAAEVEISLLLDRLNMPEN